MFSENKETVIKEKYDKEIQEIQAKIDALTAFDEGIVEKEYENEVKMKNGKIRKEKVKAFEYSEDGMIKQGLNTAIHFMKAKIVSMELACNKELNDLKTEPA